MHKYNNVTIDKCIMITIQTPKRGKLFGGTVPLNNTLFGGTVPPNSTLFGGTLDSDKERN